MWPDVASIPNLSDHQRSTVTVALSSPLGILCGTPGTGKTHTASQIARAIVAQRGSHSIRVAAPTGKAAVRCTALMKAAGLELEATTIHRMLGVSRNGHDGDGWGFIHRATNPLPFRFILLDEVSMLGTSLAAPLFDAIRSGTHVLLVGDPYQLPPVDHGAPLRDMMGAGVPCGELTEIWRNEGGVVRACKAIKDGRGYRPSKEISVANGENLRHIECRSSVQTLDVIRGLLSRPPAGIDPVWDVQVLVAVNEKSEVSRTAINGFLQGLLNPNGESPHEACRFRVGDKVICLSNCLLGLIGEDGEPVKADDGYGGESGGGTEIDDDESSRPSTLSDFVANGEIGRVVRFSNIKPHDPSMDVAFDSPSRTVRVPLGSFSGKNSSDFDLAYAVTVHKSQGSQWPIVITVIDDYRGADFIACRELYYTAISRVEKLGFTVGRMQTINRHCGKVALAGRKTFMAEGIREAG